MLQKRMWIRRVFFGWLGVKKTRQSFTHFCHICTIVMKHPVTLKARFADINLHKSQSVWWYTLLSYTAAESVNLLNKSVSTLLIWHKFFLFWFSCPAVVWGLFDRVFLHLKNSYLQLKRQKSPTFLAPAKTLDKRHADSFSSVFRCVGILEFEKLKVVVVFSALALGWVDSLLAPHFLSVVGVRALNL